MADPQLTTPPALLGSQLTTRALGREATTWFPFSITAHARTYAPMDRGSSLIALTEWFFSCALPTLPAGRLAAAYEVPPSATKSARYATVFSRRWDRIRFIRFSARFLLSC
jgi:hypothetical protein